MEELIEPKKEIIFFEDKRGRKPFFEWLKSLDNSFVLRIDERLTRLSAGYFGDYKVLQKGIKELRFTFGAGYRIYFAEHGDKVILLLVGGDKKTQRKDITKAIHYWNEYKERNYD
jgi:putative addiction module killer protein